MLREDERDLNANNSYRSEAKGINLSDGFSGGFSYG